jgi:hypothetical protein
MMGSKKEWVFLFKLNFTQQMQLSKEHVQPTWHQKVIFYNHFAQIVSKKLGLGNLLTFHDIANWFHYYNHFTFCSLFTQNVTNNCNFLVNISTSKFML